VPFEKAVKIFEAQKNEQPEAQIPEIHYQHINRIVEQFEADIITQPEIMGDTQNKADTKTNNALKNLNNWLSNDIFSSEKAIQATKNLLPLIKNGTYTNLTNEIYKLRNEKSIIKIEKNIIKLSDKYISNVKHEIEKKTEPIEPKIIISETFV